MLSFAFLFKVNSVKAFTCEYDGKFVMEVDPVEGPVDIKIKDSPDILALLGTYNFITKDASIKDQWPKSGDDAERCHSLYVCYADVSRSTVGTTTTTTYEHYFEFFYDGGAAKNSSVRDTYLDLDLWERIGLALGFTSVTGGNCHDIYYTGTDEDLVPQNPTPSVSGASCGTYDNSINAIRNLYSQIASSSGSDVGSLYTQVDQETLKVQAYCQGVMEVLDWSNDCVKTCASLGEDLSKAKTDNNITVTPATSNSCNFSERLTAWIFKILSWVRYIIPAILVVLSVLDFIKAIASDSEEEIKKVTGRFVKRLIASVIILVLPAILEFLLGIFNIGVHNYCLS